MAKAKRNTSKTEQKPGLPKESEVAKVDATAKGEANASPEPEAKPAQPEAPKETKAPKKQWIVVKAFRDRDNFDKVHAEGEDVSHLEPARLDYLKQIGYVE